MKTLKVGITCLGGLPRIGLPAAELEGLSLGLLLNRPRGGVPVHAVMFPCARERAVARSR